MFAGWLSTQNLQPDIRILQNKHLTAPCGKTYSGSLHVQCFSRCYPAIFKFPNGKITYRPSRLYYQGQPPASFQCIWFQAKVLRHALHQQIKRNDLRQFVMQLPVTSQVLNKFTTAKNAVIIAFYTTFSFSISLTAPQAATNQIIPSTLICTIFHKLSIFFSCNILSFTKTTQHFFYRLPFQFQVSHYGCVAAPRIAIKLSHSFNHSGT